MKNALFTICIILGCSALGCNSNQQQEQVLALQTQVAVLSAALTPTVTPVPTTTATPAPTPSPKLTANLVRVFVTQKMIEAGAQNISASNGPWSASYENGTWNVGYLHWQWSIDDSSWVIKPANDSAQLMWDETFGFAPKVNGIRLPINPTIASQPGCVNAAWAVEQRIFKDLDFFGSTNHWVACVATNGKGGPGYEIQTDNRSWIVSGAGTFSGQQPEKWVIEEQPYRRHCC